MTGTVRVYRKGMPKSLKNLKLQRGESLVKQSGPIMAFCYGDMKTVTFTHVHAIPAQVNLYYKSLDDYGDFKE